MVSLEQQSSQEIALAARNTAAFTAFCQEASHERGCAEPPVLAESHLKGDALGNKSLDERRAGPAVKTL